MDQDLAFLKAQRLHYISHLLYRNPRGLTAKEMAALCGVSKRTILRDIEDFEAHRIPICQTDDEQAPRYSIIEGYYLPPIHLTLDDAVALFLAARLLARYADTFDPHITAALAKLAGILPPPVAKHIHATIRTLVTRAEDERFVRVLATLTTGWAEGRVVHMRYQSAGSENVHDYDLHPYFIEPSAVGSATYVIGYASFFRDLRTFKVERIQEARLMEERFEIPADFDGPALLATAWGIEHGRETTELVLRFAPSATRRVQETRWHPSQTLECHEDGGCTLTLHIAHPEEMVYWVRGWGPQVEVLAPAWLRVQITTEARQICAMYDGAPTAGA